MVLATMERMSAQKGRLVKNVRDKQGEERAHEREEAAATMGNWLHIGQGYHIYVICNLYIVIVL